MDVQQLFINHATINIFTLLQFVNIPYVDCFLLKGPFFGYHLVRKILIKPKGLRKND